jgi:hypothetical protein
LLAENCELQRTNVAMSFEFRDTFEREQLKKPSGHRRPF